MKRIAKQIRIYAPGDPSVGIFGTELLITDTNPGGFVMDFDGYAKPDEAIRDFKVGLQRFFSEWLDDIVGVEIEWEDD